MAAEEETQVNLRVVAGGGAARNQAAIGGETRERLLPRGGADVLDDDVDAAAAMGEVAHFGCPVGLAVQNHVVGAERFCFGDFLFAAHGGDDARAKNFGDLNGGAADAAASAEDENFVGWLNLRANNEHVPRGEKNERDGGGFFEAKIAGKRKGVARGSGNVFRIASIAKIAEERVFAAEIVVSGEAGVAVSAGNAGRENDFVARVKMRDEFAGGGDFAGDVAAVYVTNALRHGNLNSGNAFADPQIEMI